MPAWHNVTFKILRQAVSNSLFTSSALPPPPSNAFDRSKNLLKSTITAVKEQLILQIAILAKASTLR